MTIELFLQAGFWWFVLVLAIKYIIWVFEKPGDYQS